MIAETVFDLQDAAIGYPGAAVLTGVCLRIFAGEKVAILGVSGAGKSTLLRHLRVQRPSSVAWCPQQPALVPPLSVWHHLFMGELDRHGRVYGLAQLVRPFGAPRDRLRQLGQTLGLGDVIDIPVERLSGGQQSRVNLGRALAAHRRIFIGDEPVSALDEVQADQLMALVCERHETVVVALHDVAMARRYCSRIVVVGEGRVALDLPSAAVSDDQLRTCYGHGGTLQAAS